MRFENLLLALTIGVPLVAVAGGSDLTKATDQQLQTTLDDKGRSVDELRLQFLGSPYLEKLGDKNKWSDTALLYALYENIAHKDEFVTTKNGEKIPASVNNLNDNYAFKMADGKFSDDAYQEWKRQFIAAKRESVTVSPHFSFDLGVPYKDFYQNEMLDQLAKQILQGAQSDTAFQDKIKKYAADSLDLANIAGEIRRRSSVNLDAWTPSAQPGAHDPGGENQQKALERSLRFPQFPVAQPPPIYNQPPHIFTIPPPPQPLYPYGI